jgi:hypothetical protein
MMRIGAVAQVERSSTNQGMSPLTSQKARRDLAHAPARQDFQVRRAVPLSEAGKVQVFGAGQIA